MKLSINTSTGRPKSETQTRESLSRFLDKSKTDFEKTSVKEKIKSKVAPVVLVTAISRALSPNKPTVVSVIDVTTSMGWDTIKRVAIDIDNYAQYNRNYKTSAAILDTSINLAMNIGAEVITQVTKALGMETPRFVSERHLWRYHPSP